MKTLALTLAAFASLSVQSPAWTQEAEPASQSEQGDLNEMFRAFVAARQERDGDAVISLGEAMLAHPHWEQVTSEYQAYVHFQLAIYYWTGRSDDALNALELAEAHYEPASAINHVRGILYSDLERWRDAATELGMLAEAQPEAFSSIELRTLWRVTNGLEDAGEAETRRDFLETIVETYEPEDPFDSTDYMRVALARDHAENGRTRRAMLLIRDVGTASAAAPAYFENAFSDLWGLGYFDTTDELSEVMAEEIATLEALTREHPDNLNGAVQLIQAYSGAGRYDDAHRFALALYDRLQNEPEAFLGTADMENWFLNEWAYIRYAQGDWQHGEALMREASGLAEGGGVNVSQVINLASSQIRRGGYNDALDTLADFDPSQASALGNMFVWAVRACAHYGLGDQAEGDANRALMEASPDANLPALQEVLACADDEEASAALFLERLADPAERASALEAVQFRRSLYPEAIYAAHHVWRERLRAMHQRPEVQAAVAEHGRAIELPIYQVYFGDS